MADALQPYGRCVLRTVLPPPTRTPLDALRSGGRGVSECWTQVHVIETVCGVRFDVLYTQACDSIIIRAQHSCTRSNSPPYTDDSLPPLNI